MKVTTPLNPVVLLLFLFQLSMSASAQNQPFISDSLQSRILNETRELRVILPQEYADDTSRRYEVLYICDGEWYQELVPFTYNFAESSGYAPKSIFVLMRNRYLNGRNLRDRDFSPTHVSEDSISGGADKFYDFVRKEVVPYVEQKFRASGQRTLVGSSFSGLFTVYSFLKDPAFFQSFVASDPNIIWDNSYVTKLAAKNLRQLNGPLGTLFIAGLQSTYRDMGGFGFDSVLKANAPDALKWRCIAYPDETHYSVQLKAFYDGFRFSHFGFSSRAPEFHPAKGMLTPGRSFMIYSLNNNPSAHFTANGSAPTPASPLMKRDTTIVITSPGKLRIKTFGNRPAYNQEFDADYTAGKISPKRSGNKKEKSALTYRFFEGSWDTIPDATSLQPAKTGIVDSVFKINEVLRERSGLLAMEGMIEVTQDADYVFHMIGFDAVELTVGEKNIFSENGKDRNLTPSYIVSLAKGKYPVRLMVLHKTAALDTHFSMYRSTGPTDHWWENRMFDY